MAQVAAMIMQKHEANKQNMQQGMAQSQQASEAAANTPGTNSFANLQLSSPTMNLGIDTTAGLGLNSPAPEKNPFFTQLGNMGKGLFDNTRTGQAYNSIRAMFPRQGSGISSPSQIAGRYNFRPGGQAQIGPKA